MDTTTISGAELLRRALLREDVEVMFGHPGGAILPFYDALHGRKAPRHVLVRHEQAAAHAADGYARATGRVGVCVATSGPGATNLVTGLATALMDSVPMVAVTGQVPSGLIGSEAFQETDIVGVTMPVTKHGFLVERPEELPAVVAEAFRIARTGRPGPVLVDIPKDVQSAMVPRSVSESGGPGVTGPGTAGHDGELVRSAGPLETGTAAGGPAASAVRDDAVRRAADLLARSRRPVLMAGRGILLSGTRETLVELAERTEAPVVTTLLGLDGFPASHRLATGMPGMHGTERANRTIQEADLVVGLGLRFDDRVTGRLEDFAPEARIVHFDVNPAVIGRAVPVDHAVVGDLRETLPGLLEAVEPARRATWWTRLRGWSREAEKERPEVPGDALGARAAIRRLARRIGDRGGVVTTDVGQHQMWFAQELERAQPGTHLTSGGLGTMGYALPAAVGAAVARPDREIWAVTGDGGFQMTLQELATVVQERLPVRVAVINNGSLGMVRQWQEVVYDGRFMATALSGPDFVLLARAFGVPASGIDTAEELDRALERSAEIRGPLLLDIRVPAEEKVFPMLPPGAALHEAIVGAAPEPVPA